MNVLFYLEPAIEFQNPLFRYATLRNSLLPQIKALAAQGEEVALLASSIVIEQAYSDGYDRSIKTFISVDPVEWTDGENSHKRSMRHLQDEMQDGEIDRLRSLIFASIPTDFNPDLIIAWESPVNYLAIIFPNARIIYQMPGFFSRPPFASLVSMDTGLLSKSQKSDSIDSTTLSLESAQLKQLRIQDQTFINRVSPVHALVAELRGQFRSIVLFPLQLDGYFMIDAVLGKRYSQFDILIELISKTPTDVAVLVTNYKSKDSASAVLSNSNIEFLRKRFSNFIYRSVCDTVPNVSQFLAPVVDGIISISSSLGYQAAFWQKPLFTVGESHISRFSTCANFEQFLTQVKSKQPLDRDKEIIELVRTRHPTMEFVSGDGYASWLATFAQTGKFTPWSEGEVALTLAKHRRESATLQQIGYAANVANESSIDHCMELSQQIPRYETISFDIFDTLLQRPFKSPADMFDFMDSEVRALTNDSTINFRDERKRAEKIAFDLAIARGDGEITIAEIYNALADNLQLPLDLCKKIMDLEMKFEFDLLYARISGYKAFQEAKTLGKRIVLISDMYLPKTLLERVLKKNGYDGYSAFFLSCEYREKKHSGRLFDLAIKELGVAPGSILHIGDNLDADVKKAKDRGIKPFHLPKASEVFLKTDAYQRPWTRDESSHPSDWKIVLAIIANKLHDNPYLPQRKGTVFSGDAWRLGYYGLGPLLLGYVKWVLEQARRDGVDALYFLSRDGKVMKEAYDLLAEAYDDSPASNYLLCSRRAVNLAKITDVAGIMDLLHVDFAHRTTLGTLLTHRFGLNQSDIPLATLEQHGYNWDSRLEKNDLPRLRKLFIQFKETLLAVAHSERQNYLSYVDSIGLFDGRKSAIVDIGYAGTMQESLWELSGQRSSISGYYLITFRSAIKRILDRKLQSRGFLAEFIDRHDTHHPFCKNVPLFETLFSSGDTSFVRMAASVEGSNRPVFMQRSVSEATRERQVGYIHRGAIEFVKDAVNILGSHIQKLDIEPNKSLRVLNQLFSDPHPRDARIFSGVVFEDAYGGAGYKTILPEDDQLSAKCVWQAGLAARLRDASVSKEKVSRSVAHSESKVNKEDAGGISVNVKLAPSEDHALQSKVQRSIYWALTQTLQEKRRNKFIRNPRLFFFDSKSIIMKAVGKIYLRTQIMENTSSSRIN